MIYSCICELPDRYKAAIVKAVNLIIKRHNRFKENNIIWKLR